MGSGVGCTGSTGSMIDRSTARGSQNRLRIKPTRKPKVCDE